jgi:hypothetical protein
MKNLQRRVTALAAALLTAGERAGIRTIDTIPGLPRMFPAYPADETRPTGVMLKPRHAR